MNKPENTLQNKRAFFRAYSDCFENDIDLLLNNNHESMITLKDPRKVLKKDAALFIHLIQPEIDLTNAIDIVEKNSSAYRIIEPLYNQEDKVLQNDISPFLMLKGYHFLRKRRYFVSWNGLTLDDALDYGWIRF